MRGADRGHHLTPEKKLNFEEKYVVGEEGKGEFFEAMDKYEEALECKWLEKANSFTREFPDFEAVVLNFSIKVKK